MSETKAKKINTKIDPEEMAQVGLHFGHKTSRVHPKIKPYLQGVRNTVHIFDLAKTAEKLNEALEFISQAVADNKALLIVGTKVQAKELVKKMAEECGTSYIIDRWLGGTITNFDSIKKRVEYFKELERKREAGELESYTKKERAKFDKEIGILSGKFGGIKNLEKTPDVLILLDLKKDNLAIREAKAKGIKVVGVADTNCDPSLVDYPIPANDDAASSLKYILDKIQEVILKNKPKT